MHTGIRNEEKRGDAQKGISENCQSVKVITMLVVKHQWEGCVSWIYESISTEIAYLIYWTNKYQAKNKKCSGLLMSIQRIRQNSKIDKDAENSGQEEEKGYNRTW